MELRVGVSGHRHLADTGGAARAVDAQLDDLLTDPDTTLVAVSSLAEGADRIVAERALARGGSLDVQLPLPPDDYAEDFPATTGEFDALLAAARHVTVVPKDRADDSREAAYERAGHAVLAECDVLLALWDGEPARGQGGTADMVAQARRAGVPVRVVPVERAVAP